MNNRQDSRKLNVIISHVTVKLTLNFVIYWDVSVPNLVQFFCKPDKNRKHTRHWKLFGDIHTRVNSDSIIRSIHALHWTDNNQINLGQRSFPSNLQHETLVSTAFHRACSEKQTAYFFLHHPVLINNKCRESGPEGVRCFLLSTLLLPGVLQRTLHDLTSTVNWHLNSNDNSTT